MTTFTTEDRIFAEKDGSLTINVNAGKVTASPPHIVDSGASVINNEPVAWVYRIKNTTNNWELNWKKPMTDELFESIPLYTHPAKTLTDEEVIRIVKRFVGTEPLVHEIEQAILKKASEK